MFNRREFLALSGAAAAAGPPGLIGDIQQQTIWRGRQGGTVWFHPRACPLPGGRLLMTCQSITGSDVFGPIHWSESSDQGKSWSAPEPIPGMGRHVNPDGFEEGVCDVVPEYHAPTRTVLAMGHNVYYKDGKLARPSEQRWPVYVVRRPDGGWNQPRRMTWSNPEASAIFTCGCAQRVTLPGGHLLVPLSLGPLGRPDRAVCTARCSFDGREVKILRAGAVLRLPVKRGLLEPSLAAHAGRYYMTIRAEDDRGYVTVSRDGLAWAAMRPWCWDDGEPLAMSSTQQRWLTHSAGLHLVYTRKAPENANVIRWRAPLYVAQVDIKRLCLIRATEQVAVPLQGDGVRNPDGVAQLGNFHTMPVSPDLSMITVGETLHKHAFRGDTLSARIHWTRRNRDPFPH
jgi:hypothetical protein